MKLIKSRNAESWDSKKIRAILIDSGRVLNGPITGHWFITPNFFKYVDKKDFYSILESKKNDAFSSAMNYISKQNLILTEEEEYGHFLEYYRIFFSKLSELKMDEEKIDVVARDLVFNYDKYKFYEDVMETIQELSQNYKLAVVSDAWPSLENIFKHARLRDYFSSFIISSQKGITKPNELMYKYALEELNVSAEETIFIDDSIKNCDGANKLGIKSFLLCRDLESYNYNKITCEKYTVIRSLKDIVKIMK